MVRTRLASHRSRRRSPVRRDILGGAIEAPSTAFALLVILAIALWVGGGASMADVWGQSVVRGTATLGLVLVALFGARPDWRCDRPALIFIAAALLLVLVQLIPLPPSIWLHLPGRAPFAEAAGLAGQGQPWRPIAIVPSGAANAATSLIVPLAVVALLAALRPEERDWLPVGVLIVISGAALVGLLQSTAATYENPLINDEPGVASGVFANRNHFSLFMAVGCVLAPAWAWSRPQHGLGWRGPVALGLVLLYTALIVVSGSRAGLLLGALAVVVSAVLVQAPVRAALRGYPRWVFPMLLLLVALGMCGLIWASISADRAISVSRAVGDDVIGDVRVRAASTIWAMAGHYFPIGSGAGGFDPIFRVHEPFKLLDVTYLNHAHNDFVEIVLDDGAAGALLLILGVLWWARGTWRAWAAWFAGRWHDALLPCAASIALLLVGLASLVDYPARTPLIMALLVVLSGWLVDVRPRESDEPLPNR